ncbi:type VI secretion system tube protein TssD [Aquimarina algiphila]|uniref:type VI secretion system tube protein TssD n=1 Tax=Aquimarina algiphila TaxID=2047982 RepID=UPI00232DECB0|nr:type VI secretion system tube protein TssD [Aquimarina algiphila]
MIVAKLKVFGQEREVVNAEVMYHRMVNHKTGRAGVEPLGGLINLSVLSGQEDDILLRWITHAEKDELCMLTEGELSFHKGALENPSIFQYKFNDAALVEYKEVFTSQGENPMTISLVISPAIQKYKWQTHIKHWQESWVPPSEQQPYQSLQNQEEETKDKEWETVFKCDNTDRKNGVYGWDQWKKSLENKCTSDKTKYHNAYNWIKVNDQDYPVSILSMRKGQSVTLELDHSTKKKKQYQSVQIEPNPNFDIQPMDIKEAKKVTIQCLNNAATTSQIKVKADGNDAGALEIWHPVPKKVKLRWVFVEFKGGRNNNDFTDLSKIIDKAKLSDYFKKSLNPALIDVDFANPTAELLDIPAIKAMTSKAVAATTDKSAIKDKKAMTHYVKNIESAFLDKDTILYTEKDKNNFVQNLHGLKNYMDAKQSKNKGFDEVYVYFTNLKCGIFGGETVSYNNGVSFTGQGVSLMFLKNLENQPSVEVPHEVMHALGLPHTFQKKDSKNNVVINPSQKHTFTMGSTDNYMDYKNTKKHTFKHQWEKLYKNKYVK